jgi:hypothetical protein
LRGPQPTPSMVVSLAALVLAASGGAYAAATSSSGTIVACVHHKGGGLYIARRCARHDKHLRWNAIGPQGATGRRGATGSRGATGATGATGAAGSNGAAHGFIDANPAKSGEYLVLSESPSVVARMSLPSGSYVVQGNVHVKTISTGTPVTCGLKGGGQTLDEGAINVGEKPSLEHGDLALGGGLTLTAPGEVFVSCAPEKVGLAAAGAKITATQVTTLTSTTG